MKVSRVQVAWLLISLFALAGCKDENRLYSYDDKEAAAAPAPKRANELPEGHPPVPSQLPSGHPAIDPSQLPAGHPPINVAEGSVPLAEPPAGRDRLAASVAVQSMELAGVIFTLPQAWTEVEPLNRMRIAQMQIPSEDGAPGELAVFYFGAGQGGDAMSNITRWIGQLTLDEGFAPIVYQQKKNEFTATEVYVEGTLNASPMSGIAEPRPGSALHGVVIEGGPQGSLFVRITGPRDTVKNSGPAVASMIDKLQAVN